MWRGEKIELSEIKREYLPSYVEWFNDWEMSQYLIPGAPHPLTIEDEVDWFETRRRDKDNFVFAILALPDKKLIGNCGLHRLDWKNRTAMFGIFIGDKDYWGKGYGTDAVRTILRFGFEQLDLNRVELEVYEFNTRAQRAYEKAGFRREGVHRQALYRNGRFYDVIMMGILRQEWSSVNPG